MRAIEREWRVASIAAENLGEYPRANPSVLAREQLGTTDYRNFRDNLEPTYLIRIFAEFEAGMREAWERAFHQATTPRMRDLIDSKSARCIISQDRRDCIHVVRTYRNALIHEGGRFEPVGLRESCGWLCRSFSRLPHEW
jgi:hypothetical protein